MKWNLKEVGGKWEIYKAVVIKLFSRFNVSHTFIYTSNIETLSSLLLKITNIKELTKIAKNIEG